MSRALLPTELRRLLRLSAFRSPLSASDRPHGRIADRGWRRAFGPSPSPLPDSNRRPPPYHGGALPAELRGRVWAGGPDTFEKRYPFLGLSNRTKAEPQAAPRNLDCKGVLSHQCREKDLNLRRHCRQIYSLLPLAARASRHQSPARAGLGA